MDEKIFFSDKEHKTIAELKAIGGINLPVFKDGKKMYKTSLEELLSASPNTVVLPYETATYAIINDLAQSGKQVIIYYTGVDDAQFWTLSHKTAESSLVFTWLKGNSLVKMTLSSGNVWSEEAIDLKAIKDNARDDVTDPIHTDNITDIEQLIFVRNVGVDANYTEVTSEERTYGILLPAPSLQADHGKVPMYKTGNQIAWETPPTQDLVSLTITPVIVDTTATLTIEQGGFASIDLTSEAALTAVSVVLTNTAGVAMPVWWFKIKVGSDITLSVEIGAVAVGWLGSAITNIALGKTVEINVVDGIACGGELV